MDFPNPVSGNSPQASWLNRLLAASRASVLLSGVNYRVRRSTGGTCIEPMATGGKGSPGGSGSTMYKITALNGSSGGADYFTARTWDGTTLGAADVLVAKYWHQRRSTGSEVIDGVVVTYNHIDDNNRIASDGTNSENDVVFPRYVVGGIIWADQPVNGTLVAGKTWMELRPPRVWAKRYTA